MDLIVFELGLTGSFGNTQLSQQVRIANRDMQLEAIRPHLYVENTPAGSLFMEVQDANNKTIATSNVVSIGSIDGGATYFHGYIRFDIKVGLRQSALYNVALKHTGYTYNASSFVGWCNDFDLKKVTANVPSPVGVSSPLDMELWERKQVMRG